MLNKHFLEIYRYNRKNETINIISEIEYFNFNPSNKDIIEEVNNIDKDDLYNIFIKSKLGFKNLWDTWYWYLNNLLNIFMHLEKFFKILTLS